MSDIKHQIAALALNKMMRSAFFDICAVNEAAEVLGANPRLSDNYASLRALHCVHWNQMPREIRELVPQMIADCLALPAQFSLEPSKPAPVSPLILEAIDVTAKKPLVKRILARLTA